jgi:hypothetical protein
MNLLFSEVEGGLVVGPSGIHDDAMNSAGLGDNRVYSSGDAIFFGDIGRQSENTAGILAAQSSEVVAGFADVDGVNLGRTVVEAAFGDTKANTAVGTGDCGIKLTIYLQYVVEL